MKVAFKEKNDRKVSTVDEVLRTYKDHKYIGCIMTDDIFFTIENLKKEKQLKGATHCIPVIETDIMVLVDANEL